MPNKYGLSLELSAITENFIKNFAHIAINYAYVTWCKIPQLSVQY